MTNDSCQVLQCVGQVVAGVLQVCCNACPSAKALAAFEIIGCTPGSGKRGKNGKRQLSGVAVQCVAVQCVAVQYVAVQCVAVCCGVLQCVAVCCSELQCAAVIRTKLKKIKIHSRTIIKMKIKKI